MQKNFGLWARRHDIRSGYFTDAYFNRTRAILLGDGNNADVTMQIFQKTSPVIVCGIAMAKAYLRIGAGRWTNLDAALRQLARLRAIRRAQDHDEACDPEIAEEIALAEENLDTLWMPATDLEIQSLMDGRPSNPWDSVMQIRGCYADFAHLETLYLGCLTKQTAVASNAHACAIAAHPKPVYFFGARHASPSDQEEIGYAALMGGISGVSTDANGAWLDIAGSGTMPHALIASYGGSTVDAAIKYAAAIPAHETCSVLVDFDNDCALTAVDVATTIGSRLNSVRLDTSEMLIDRGLFADVQERQIVPHGKLAGVSEELVWRVRHALDAINRQDVGIFVSGGFTPEKIRRFEEHHVPVNAYGVGSAITDDRGGAFDYTADIVEPVAKVGRGLAPNHWLE